MEARRVPAERNPEVPQRTAEGGSKLMESEIDGRALRSDNSIVARRVYASNSARGTPVCLMIERNVPSTSRMVHTSRPDKTRSLPNKHLKLRYEYLASHPLL